MVLPLLTAAHRRSITTALITGMSKAYRDDYSSSKDLSTKQSISKDTTSTASPAESEPSYFFGNIISHDPSTPSRANATLVMLARNSDLDGLEANFNHKFKYPWMFLNDEPFSYRFKRHTVLQFSAVDSSCIFRRVKALTGADVSFGLIPSENWAQPS
ncbi:glycolipid 2-alpha-mannosyltransferase-domain-containing protein [Suillus lakei]|nr:glycolipid 2-alpha-mannosyltransferase-domain-containing protein [Suillus lakei]